jgi:hypothetical protein
MRHLFLILSLLFSVSASAALQYKPIKASQCDTLLQPGMNLYSTWKCEPCGELNSMRPDQQGRVQCMKCDKPHTNESFAPFVQREEAGQIYVRSVDIISKANRDRFDLSYRFECPSCKASNFGFTAEAVGKETQSCVECGTSLKDAKKLVEIAGEKHLISLDQYAANHLNDQLIDENSVFRIINQVRGQFLEMRGSGVGISVEEVDGVILKALGDFAAQNGSKYTGAQLLQMARSGKYPGAQSASSRASSVQTKVVSKAGQAIEGATGMMDWLRARRRTLLGVAGATVVASSVAAATYGYQPVVHEGVVHSIQQEHIDLKIRDGGETVTITIKNRPDLKVRIGDQIWVHTRTWFKSHRAIEFESGDFANEGR